jgi:hypothetical protein
MQLGDNRFMSKTTKMIQKSLAAIVVLIVVLFALWFAGLLYFDKQEDRCYEIIGQYFEKPYPKVSKEDQAEFGWGPNDEMNFGYYQSKVCLKESPEKYEERLKAEQMKAEIQNSAQTETELPTP